MSAVFEELYFKQEKMVKLNYFAEYHGKSIVDGHFGVLSRWLKDITSLKFVNEIPELIHEFSEKEKIRQEEAREKLTENSLYSQSKFYFLTYNRKNRSKKRTYEMENMKNYLSFFISENELYKSYFSYLSSENYTRIRFNKKEIKDERPTKRSYLQEDYKNKNTENDFIGKKSYTIQQSCKRFMDKYPIEMEP